VCRGAQILNVARGGTLIQDIPSFVTGHVEHLIQSPPLAIAHEVWISTGSRLAALMRDTLEGADTCGVNSRHHQAVDHPAAGFAVTATAPDGVVEAIELSDTRFCLGVQWHPENFWRTGEFRAIFEGFVDACRQTHA
jgi:putative glutamine amidotransferase